MRKIFMDTFSGETISAQALLFRNHCITPEQASPLSLGIYVSLDRLFAGTNSEEPASLESEYAWTPTNTWIYEDCGTRSRYLRQG